MSVSSALSVSLDSLPFAVVDVETTGFSPRLHDRLVEIAIVRITPDGSPEDEYATLINPFRDVGPTHIHGITATDLVEAPTFVEVMGDVLERLRQAVFVAHNVRFDRDFIAAEFSMAGVFLPAIPCLCTLELAYRLHPGLENHRLATCCAAAGLRQDRVHSALEDARAVAHLLVAYLRQAKTAGWTTLDELGCSPLRFPLDLWPTLPASGRCMMRTRVGEPIISQVPFLARVVASLTSAPMGGPRLAPYMDLLDRVLEDRIVTETEAEVLQATAADWGLSREEVMSAHHAFLDSLITAAMADGTISELERRDLEAVTRLLALDPSVLHALLNRTMGPVSLPGAVPLGTVPSDSLAGLTVCFTGTLTGRLGDEPISRQVAHELAEAAGLRVVMNVTKGLDILVVADPNTLSGKARTAGRFGTRIMAEAAFWHAIGVQVQ
jgi:DNA polymerase-3 subunit epsilon